MGEQERRTTIKDWLEVASEEDQALGHEAWRIQRLKRLHGLQIAQDVVAHAQNIPLRLLRSRNLGQLGAVFEAFVRTWRPEVEQILLDVSQRHPRLQQYTPQQAAAVVDDLQNPVYVERLRDWVLSLATSTPQPRPDIPPHFDTWFIELLPHLERDIWLTEMSNPHPAHSLARMVEHWSLFVLMWAWKNVRPSEERESKVITSALGMTRLGLVLVPAFRRQGRGTGGTTDGDDVSLLLGPFELEPADGSSVERATDESRASWFDRPFRAYLEQVAQTAEVWWDVEEKAPGRTELLDAFATRAPMGKAEVRRRTEHSVEALRLFLDAELDPSVFATDSQERPLSRANWETAATLCTWFQRWKPVLARSGGGDTYRFRLSGHRIVMECGPLGARKSERPRLVMMDAQMATAAGVKDGQEFVKECMRQKDTGLWIETPGAFLSRARERQHALWTSHAVAIHNLLTRHSRHDRPIGPDQDLGEPTEPTCDEADFLLRGYGGRVCQYLLQMARAEVAFILWLDYSTGQPTVRHVGGADRLVQHRAQRRERFKTFIEWAHAPSGEPGVPSPAEAGADSASQIYRAIAAAEIEPHSRKFDKAHAQGRAWLQAHFDHYAAPQPEDGIAVPLLFNGRVVGAFYIAGIASSRHFDDRLDAPLRRVAQLLAQAMAKQAQLWQMRRLNWLAAHRPLDLWRRHDVENQYNPLEPVARILANIFLCPVVHIWLRDAQNPKRYKLHGYTHPELFASQGRPLQRAPQFLLRASGAPGENMPIERQFIAFACDQWLHADGDAQAGSYVQARFQDDVDTRAAYCAAQAGRGGLRLGLDFIHADEQSGLRKALFVDHRLHQIMALALVDTSAKTPEPVGIVSLHAPIPTRDGHHLPWPPGWRQVVGHVQTYIPYVLTQTEAIANPLENLRRYLLHEGRNEFNQVAAQGNQLRGALLHLLAPDEPAGHARPWLRKTAKGLLNQGKARRNAPDTAWLRSLADELGRIERQLADAWPSFEAASSARHAENLLSLARLITHQRDVAALGNASANLQYDHEADWLPLHSLIFAALSAYERTWKDEGIWLGLDELPRDLRILASRSLFDWMLRDLVHNLAKYALRNEPITVSWHKAGAREERAILRLRNVSTFDPERDNQSRLMLFGVQGSAGLNPPRALSSREGVAQQGQGIGLWGAAVLSQVLDMPLSLHVSPRPDGRTAHYQFDFKVPARMVG